MVEAPGCLNGLQSDDIPALGRRARYSEHLVPDDAAA